MSDAVDGMEIVVPDIDDVLAQKNDEAKMAGMYLASLEVKLENILEKTQSLLKPGNDLPVDAFDTLATFSKWLRAMDLDILKVKQLVLSMRNSRTLDDIVQTT